MTEQMKDQAFDLLEMTGLNWTVNKEPLVTADGKETRSHGIFRNDTGRWLGTVGDRYTPYQNYQMAELLVKAADGVGLALSRGGELNLGERVYLQANLPDDFVGKSAIKRWLTCLNSHNGSTSIGFGSTNTTVICQNTFNMAMRDMGKFRHSANAETRLKEAMEDMRKAIGLDEKLMQSFKVMADIPLNEALFARLTKSLFNVEKDTKQADLSGRKRNQLTAFAGAMETSIQEQGATVWAMFNGITRYVNHIAAPSDPAKKADYLMNSELSNTGYNEIMKFINENMKQYASVLQG